MSGSLRAALQELSPTPRKGAGRAPAVESRPRARPLPAVLRKPAGVVQRLPAPAGARRRARGKESPLVTAILQALWLKGIWAWRANSGTQVIKASSRARRRVIKGAPAGTPDILLVLPKNFFGTLCGLEVKTATGRQLPSQRAWQAKAEANGVRYAVVRSIREALAAVEAWT